MYYVLGECKKGHVRASTQEDVNYLVDNLRPEDTGSVSLTWQYP